jgi:hypothetical protein
MRFEEVHDRYRRHNAVEICIERIKRVEFSASVAVQMLIEAAEGDTDVLLGLGGSGGDDEEQSDERFSDDPLMRYVDGLIDVAVGGGEAPAVGPSDAVLMAQERRLLNLPLAEAFTELCQLVPGLGTLEAELGANGELADPTERTGWRRRLNRGFPGRTPKVSFFLALRPRLDPLVGGQASAERTVGKDVRRLRGRVEPSADTRGVSAGTGMGRTPATDPDAARGGPKPASGVPGRPPKMSRR